MDKNLALPLVYLLAGLVPRKKKKVSDPNGDSPPGQAIMTISANTYNSKFELPLERWKNVTIQPVMLWLNSKFTVTKCGMCENI